MPRFQMPDAWMIIVFLIWVVFMVSAPERLVKKTLCIIIVSTVLITAGPIYRDVSSVVKQVIGRYESYLNYTNQMNSMLNEINTYNSQIIDSIN